MEKAVELYKALIKRNISPSIVTLSAGTPHKPNPLDRRSYPIFESSAGMHYLLSRNIPAECLFEEKVSLDTIGNAYFLRAIHTEFSNWRRLIIITNNWHMDRTRAIFDTVFHLPLTASLQFTKYALEYHEVDSFLPPKDLIARKQREFQSLETFSSKTVFQFKTFYELHHWIFTQHIAYSALRFTRGHQERLDEATLQSY